MTSELEKFWNGATFIPDADPFRSDQLRERVWKANEAAFIAFALKLTATEPALYRNSRISAFFQRFKCLPSDERRSIIEWPPFLIWLRQSSVRDRVEIERMLGEFERLIIRFADKADDSFIVRNIESSILIVRFEIDPLIAREAGPEYQIPDVHRRREFEDNVEYPLSFFREMVTIALDRIKQAWPEAYRDFFKFVRMIVDMIDGEFTSYSAANLRGVIFVSTDNSPLVALEEYLIHEFGHQVLYQVMELDPLVLPGNKQIFTLPWSGNERDLYGYFHAYFIYVLLARYLDRVTGRSEREQRRIAGRRAHVVKGLLQATQELDNLDSFTARGRHLFQNLKAEVYDLSPVVKQLGSTPRSQEHCECFRLQIANL